MTVKELIEVLRTFPPDLEVAYEMYSEYLVLEAKDLEVKALCYPREDGWVHDARPDKPLCGYLVFPGN